MARWGYRWIKVHRYWFGYTVSQGYPVLTNVIYDAADLPGRVKDPDEEIPVLRPGGEPG